MSSFTESNLNNLNSGDKSSTISSKVLPNFISSTESSDVSALLQAVIDDQYSLRKEVVNELENSRCRIRDLVVPMLNELSDRVDVNLIDCGEFTESFGKYCSKLTKPIPTYVETSRRCDDSKPDACERTAALARKLIHDQNKFRCNLFSLLRNQTEEITDEMFSLIDVTKSEIDQKLKSIETDVKMLLPLYERTLNSVGCVFSQIEAVFGSLNAKVDVLEQKLRNVENSTAAGVASCMTTDYRNSSKIPDNDDDTCSVLSCKTDTSSILQDLKAMVTRQNLNTPVQRRSNDGNLKHTIVESPMKIDVELLASWLQQPTQFEYKEEIFWSRFKSLNVMYVPTQKLTIYLKRLVIHSVTHESKVKFFELALYCATQLRNPDKTDELLMAQNDGPFHYYANGTRVELDAPVIDWEALSANADEIFASLTEMEKEFIADVMAMDDETLVIWGCSYACIMTQLHEKGTITIVNKLKRLNEELELIYDVTKDRLPAIPICEAFYDKLQAYAEFELGEWDRNTLFKGMIERYVSSPDNENIRRLLNYVILSSLRYKGMPLLTLVDEVLKTYQVSLDELMSCTTYSKTVDSWKNFYSFISSDIYTKSKKWKYCAVFDPTSYSIFSLDANLCLYWLLCHLLDVKCAKNNQSSKLFRQLQEKTKPEWFTNELISLYLKKSLRHLREYSKVM